MAERPPVARGCVRIGQPFLTVRQKAAGVRRVGATADGCCIGPRNGLVGTRSTASPFSRGESGTQWNAFLPFLGRL